MTLTVPKAHFWGYTPQHVVCREGGQYRVPADAARSLKRRQLKVFSCALVARGYHGLTPCCPEALCLGSLLTYPRDFCLQLLHTSTGHLYSEAFLRHLPKIAALTSGPSSGIFALWFFSLPLSPVSLVASLCNGPQ